jgi:hypothetical protein
MPYNEQRQEGQDEQPPPRFTKDTKKPPSEDKPHVGGFRCASTMVLWGALGRTSPVSRGAILFVGSNLLDR